MATNIAMSRTLRVRDIFDAVYGSVIGGAIGDALGAPIKGWYYREIRDRVGVLTDFEDWPSTVRKDNAPDGPGGVTDDTALAHYISLAIIRKGGRITPDDLAAVWLEKGENKRFFLNERVILRKLVAGMSTWDSGRGAIPAGCAIMAIGPIGIINAGNPAQAYQDAANSQSSQHRLRELGGCQPRRRCDFGGRHRLGLCAGSYRGGCRQHHDAAQHLPDEAQH